MAPRKQGLDYFPFQVTLLRDPKLRQTKLRYGSMGVHIYLALLSILYEDKGYYIDYGSDKAQDDVIWIVMELTQGKHSPSGETVREVIECLVACELFSGDQFRRGIITSQRSQIEFYRATVDRKAVEINFDIWLLTEIQMKSLSIKSSILRNFYNRPILPDNRPISGDNQPISTQSRVEESRVEESRVSAADAVFGEAVGYFMDKIQPVPSGITTEQMKEYAETMTAEVIIHAIDKAITEKVYKWSYINSILRDWQRQGVQTIDDAHREEAEWERRKSSNNRQSGAYAAANAIRNYDDDEDF